MTPPAQMNPAAVTAATYLNLAPQLVSVIQALELAIPAPKNGPTKLTAFTNIALQLFAAGGPLVTVGIGQHDPSTIIQLSTIFAAQVIGAINSSKTVQAPTPQLVATNASAGIPDFDPLTPR